MVAPTTAPSADEALAALQKLLAAGRTKEQIADMIGAGWRSVHRWSRNEAKPTVSAHRRALVAAAEKIQAHP
jgi:transposase